MTTTTGPKTVLSKGRAPHRLEDKPAIDIGQFVRSLDFFDPILHDPMIIMIGAGGIGSWVVFQLAKLGVRRITVIDHDIVSNHNLSTTPYHPKDLKQPKVEALKRVVESTPVQLRTINRKFKGNPEDFKDADIVISGVDSMAARALIYKWVKKVRVPFFIDGRIGAENWRVYAIQPNKRLDARLYQRTLMDDKFVAPLPCTGQQVIDVGWTVASMITRAVRQWVAQGIYNPELVHKQDTLVGYVAPRRHRVSRPSTPRTLAGNG